MSSEQRVKSKAFVCNLSRLPTKISFIKFPALCTANIPLKTHFLFFSLFSFLFSLFLSCASISPVTSERERPESFPTIESVTPQWQPFVLGIDYFHGKIAEPRLEFWALQVDLTSPDIRITVRGGAENSAEGGGQTLSTRVSSFVRDNNLIAGINALPFYPVSGREREPRINVGIVIADGVMVSPAVPGYDALVFYTDGRAAIVSQSSIRSTDNIKNAVGGFFQILTDGDPALRAHSKARHPRSAAGISTDGRFLYLLVIDGRRAGSIGSTEKETALLLRALGSAEGINFDGGGSSALALRFSNSRVRVVNTPIHNRIRGWERAVAGCLGIYKKYLPGVH